MNSKTFFYLSLFLGTLLVVIFMVINIHLDIYGIHQQSELKNKKVYFNEGYSKYLLAKNYVPKNFNGILIGPSLSDNINTKNMQILDIYNLSFMGARMDDLDTLIKTAISSEENKIKNVIICLNPYLTELNSEYISDLSEYAYKESFGSYNLIKTYLISTIRHSNLLPNKYPNYQFNSYGFNNYDNLFKVKNVENRINMHAESDASKKIEINSEALQKLEEIKEFLKSEGISLLVYFHPIPKKIYSAGLNSHKMFKQKVLDLFENDLNHIDFNSQKYSYITNDHTNYIDHGHLSKKGQLEIIRILEKYFADSLSFN